MHLLVRAACLLASAVGGGAAVTEVDRSPALRELPVGETDPTDQTQVLLFASGHLSLLLAIHISAVSGLGELVVSSHLADMEQQQETTRKKLDLSSGRAGLAGPSPVRGGSSSITTWHLEAAFARPGRCSAPSSLGHPSATSLDARCPPRVLSLPSFSVLPLQAPFVSLRQVPHP